LSSIFSFVETRDTSSDNREKKEKVNETEKSKFFSYEASLLKSYRQTAKIEVVRNGGIF